jgi:hypothetical protein
VLHVVYEKLKMKQLWFLDNDSLMKNDKWRLHVHALFKL